MKMGKVFRTVGIVLGAMVLLNVLLCLTIGRIAYPEFHRVAEEVQTIPGLNGDFVPQGVTVAEDGTILVCGYSFSLTTPSRIFRLDGKGHHSVIYLANEDGSAYRGHAGGLTAAGKYVYVSSSSKIFILDTEAVLSAEDGTTLFFKDHFSVPCRSSYCSSDGEYLYVGEYHKVGYATDESHKVTTSSGKNYQAITFGYRLDGEGKAETVPSIAYATCDLVQGFAMVGSTAVLSCSSGFHPSSLRFYEASGSDDVFVEDGTELPLVILDERREKHVLEAPHMSEDVEYRDGMLYLGFEAGARRYGAGLLPDSIRSIMRVDCSSF